MNDESEPTLEQVTAEIITQGSLRREEVCARLGIGDDMLEVCIRWEIIQLPEPDPQGIILFRLMPLTGYNEDFGYITISGSIGKESVWPWAYLSVLKNLNSRFITFPTNRTNNHQIFRHWDC